jgi:ubiquinone/menaquinone biosynthesis C-methylase UbiE
MVGDIAGQNIKIIDHDVESGQILPFPADQFDVVTMLAVLEHIEPARLPGTFSEIYRVLKVGGTFILTTPAPWTDGLLRLLAKLKLVSSVEIEEHKDAYDQNRLLALLQAAGFTAEKVKSGYFELGLNIWGRAIK